MDLPIDTPAGQRAQLDAFCQALDQQDLWEPAADNPREEIATLPMTDPTGQQLEIIARRFHGPGDHVSLRVGVWQTDGEQSLGRGIGRLYLGRVGLHHLDALPYSSPARVRHGENPPASELWRALGGVANTDAGH